MRRQMITFARICIAIENDGARVTLHKEEKKEIDASIKLVNSASAAADPNPRATDKSIGQPTKRQRK